MSNNNPYASGNAGGSEPHGNGASPTPDMTQTTPSSQGYSGYATNSGYGSGAVYGQGPYEHTPYQHGPEAFEPYSYGPSFGAPGPAIPYASWGARVGARLVDGLISCIPMAVLVTIGSVVAFQNSHEITRPDGTTDTTGINGVGVALIILGVASAFLFNFWNLGLRQGKTGQSIGKKLFHLLVVDERTGRPAGAGAGFGRYAVEFVMSLISSCVGVLSLIDVLWPLWDAKNQALHDKIVHTVVINEH